MSDQESKREGYDLFDTAWFESMDALLEVILGSEDANLRIKAAEVILRYSQQFAVGLNSPYVPEERIRLDEDDEDE